MDCDYLHSNSGKEKAHATKCGSVFVIYRERVRSMLNLSAHNQVLCEPLFV
jgi:hypothetical protein